MGIGLVGVFWLAAASCMSVSAALLTSLLNLQTGGELRRRRVGFAAAVPFLSLGWICPGGLLWVGYGKLTGLNAQFGVGDSWAQPLPYGYELLFIDVDTRASVSRAGDRLPGVADVTEIGVSGSLIYGLSKGDADPSPSGFVFDARSGELQLGSPDALFKARGVSQSGLMPVSQYPGRPRTSVDNLVLAGLLLAPPGVFAWWKWPRRARLGG